MGQLVDGTWQAGWFKPDPRGTFERPASQFRARATDLTPGRYHLYAAAACPWAHRVLITRALRGLTDAVPVTILDPHMGEHGWPFRDRDPDPIAGTERARYLYEVYLRADRRYSGRVTVPVLWDRQTSTIVNNESREIMRMFDSVPQATGASLVPPALAAEVDRVLDAIYAPINNGVYRAGFASTQASYEDAARTLFAALAEWDAVLATRPFTCGDVMTEADIALFTTLLRFDLVYYSHFKCNLARLRDHTHLWRFTRRMYQHPLIRQTCDLDAIKTHYYWSQDNVNPTRIVPIGPRDYAAALEAPIEP